MHFSASVCRCDLCGGLEGHSGSGSGSGSGFGSGCERRCLTFPKWRDDYRYLLLVVVVVVINTPQQVQT